MSRQTGPRLVGLFVGKGAGGEGVRTSRRGGPRTSRRRLSKVSDPDGREVHGPELLLFIFRGGAELSALLLSLRRRRVWCVD